MTLTLDPKVRSVASTRCKQRGWPPASSTIMYWNKIKTGHRSMLSRTKQKERKKRRNTRLNGEQSEGDGHGYDMRRRENRSEDSNELSSKDPAAALNISSLLLTGHCQAVKHKTQRDKGGAPVVWSVSSVQASHAKRRKTVLAASVGWRTEENPKMSH